MKPCGACCLRGTPSECEYGGSKQDRHYIEQSVLIENLMYSCETLKQQLEDVQREANIPPVKDQGSPSPPPNGLPLFDARRPVDNQTEIPVDTGAPTESQCRSSNAQIAMADKSTPLVKSGM